MVDYITLREAEKKERALEKKAENLQDFGTLASLTASALWFAEGAMNKVIPKPVHAISLTAVAVGIGAVIYSFKLRHDAEKVALNDDELLILRNGGANLKVVDGAKSWSDRQNEAPATPIQR